MTEEQQNRLNILIQEVAIYDAKIVAIKSIIDPLRASINYLESEFERLQYLKGTWQKAADAITPSPVE